MKHANLSTNAKASILEAVIASGQWDSLSPKDKELFIHNQQGLLAIAASQQKLNEWNSIPDEVKNYWETIQISLTTKQMHRLF